MMKTISILTLWLLTIGTASAEGLTTKIEGFMDIPWGTPADAVKKSFPTKAHTRLDQLKSTPEKLWFLGGKFAKFKARDFNLEFLNGRFWNGHVTIEAMSKDHAKEYAAIKQLLTEKYGAPDSDENRGGNLITNWHVGTGPEEKERIEISSDPAGNGLTVMYASDRFRKTLQAAPPPVADAAKKPKPVTATPGAKEDL